MRAFIRRSLILAVAMLGLAPTFLAQSPTPAEAAAKVYVDDNPANNHATVCPTSGTYLTIQDGVDNAPDGATVYVCEGVYTAGASMSGRNNLKILAKGNVQINPPAGYTGKVFDVLNSTRITLQGFVINGNSALGNGTQSTAIYYFYSSGVIKNNYILHWRYSDPTAVSSEHRAIIATGPASSGTVTIDHNTIYDFQHSGIHTGYLNKVKIARNQLVATSGAVFNPNAIVAYDSTNGTITGNTIRSSYGLYNSYAFGNGVYLEDTTSMKVTGNTITNVRTGVMVQSYCGGDTRKNTISGNKINEAAVGVRFAANATSCAYLFADNVISGNKIYSNNFALTTGGGISMAASGAMVITGTVVKGNTFAGFGYNDPTYFGAGVSGTVESGNKEKFMPPPGL